MGSSGALELATEVDRQAAELAELRALARCGRTSVPVVHLLEGDHVASRGYWYRPTYHALCCAEVDSDSSESGRFDDDAMSSEDYCPGCRDCVRYCAACIAEALRFAEQPAAAERRGE